MTSPAPRYRYRCQICGEPVGIWNEDAHWRAVHPEVLATRRTLGRRYLLYYFPLLMLCLVALGASLILQRWWWRIGLLASIYGIVAILLIFGVREWKVERPVLLRVVRSCAVCDARMAAADMRGHLEGTHPDIYRLVKRSYWLLNPGVYVVLAYLLVLLSVMMLFDLPDSVWATVPGLVTAPLFAWMIVLAVVGIVLDRTRLRPARETWRTLHP